MGIQTTGEQKYLELIEERTKTIKMGRIIWISLLAVTLIVFTSNAVIGSFLGAVGIFLAVVNTKSQKALRDKLEGISDKADFYDQLISPDAVEIKEFQLLIAKEYVLSFKKDIFIHRKSDVDKIEVGIQDGGYKPHKSLFLTDRYGNRHEIAVCDAGSGTENVFDLAYESLRT